MTENNDDRFIPWEYDRVNIAKRFRDQGDIYSAIVEVIQNAVDSAARPLEDPNMILITIPCLGDKLYGKLLLSIRDFGKGITKDYDGNIFAFLKGKKAVSPKAGLEDTIGRNGVGMIQYQKISKRQVITSMDDKMIYRFEIAQDKAGGINFTMPEQEPISPEAMEKFGIDHQGTIIDFYEPYPNQLDISPTKATNEIRKKFGWRMMEVKDLQIFVNDLGLDLPEYLQDRKPVWLCRLNEAQVELSNGQFVKRNPDVFGFLYEDKEGNGTIKVHVKGYYIQEYPFAAKRCSGAINVNDLGIDTNRKSITDLKMLADLESHMAQLMKKFADIEADDKKINKKRQNKLNELLNTMLSKYNLPKLWQKNEADKIRIKTEQTGNVNGNDVPGYAIYEHQTAVKEPETCELCNHAKLRNKHFRRICKCECHARIRKKNEHVSYVGTDGTDKTKRESDDEEDKKHNHKLNFLFNDKLDPKEELFTTHPNENSIIVNEKNPLFDWCFLATNSEREMMRRITPFLANIVMDAEHPTYIHEVQELKEFRQMHSKYMTEMLISVGEL